MLSGQGHAGDMPNLHVPPNGELSIEILNAAITLEKGKPNSVFHPGGTAVVVHEGVVATPPAMPAPASPAASSAWHRDVAHIPRR
jgi:hypothetical protein